MGHRSPYTGKIKIYSDGADKQAMLEMNANPLIKGLTTNPTLMKKAGIKDYRSFCKEILSQIKEKPISFEVFADDFREMERQALEIKSWGSNVYVKIPVTNSEGKSSMALVKELSHRGVKLNVTALLTVGQVHDTCTALKGGAPAVVSVFAGRIADTGRDPMGIMTASRELCEWVGPECELLWASTREVFNIVQAEQAGCAIITVPFDIIKKMSMFNTDLTNLSLDTVKMFKQDATSAGFTL
ncbi:MAG: transaldolase [Bdellovibrionales bacterium]|nr:transaldolase [Bdellovibrionales bacterium]